MIKIKWPNLYELLPEMECESFVLSKFRGEDTWQVPPGDYVKLERKPRSLMGNIIMSDTPMEKRTNATAVVNATGDVLIGGFGLGMVVLAMQDKPDVYSITVIENNKEIIDNIAAVLPLNEKVKVIHDDVYEWKPQRGKKYDAIWLDIWDNINSDIYKEEMRPLKNKYRRYLSNSPYHWIGAWAEWEARYDRPLF